MPSLVVYWSIFAYFALGTLLSPGQPARAARRGKTSVIWAFGIFLIVLMVGLRYQVGADWFPYQRMYSFAGYADLGKMMKFGDPGYQLLNWLIQRAGLGLWMVNLICATIFSWGLARFARVQPNPWLTVLVAIPYLVIVVAMGYTRQGVAIGILLAGLAALQSGAPVTRFLVYAAAATLFHKTAVIAVPLVLFASERNRFLNIVAGLAGAYALYSAFLAESVDVFVKNYVEAEYTAQGAAIRVAMDVVPAALFFLFRRRLNFQPEEDRLWRNFALAAFGALAMLQFMPQSTAVDRIALYLIPLQLAVLPRLGMVLRARGTGNFIVVVYCFAIMFVWLNYAQHADDWLPYQFYPLR
jgi:hypothetical protein